MYGLLEKSIATRIIHVLPAPFLPVHTWSRGTNYVVINGPPAIGPYMPGPFSYVMTDPSNLRMGYVCGKHASLGNTYPCNTGIKFIAI